MKNELYDKNDALEAWCKVNLLDDFFKDSSEVMHSYGLAISWAVSKTNHFMPKAMNEFLDAEEADAFLIAFTLADNANRIVVTHEISPPSRKNKIKIPDACIDLNVRNLNTMDMLRQMGESF